VQLGVVLLRTPKFAPGAPLAPPREKRAVLHPAKVKHVSSTPQRGGSLHPVSTATERVRQHRLRKAENRILLVLDVDKVLLADALVEARLLDFNKTDDEDALREAALRFMKIFTQENKT
jgi:hypothetical protein